MALVTRRVMDFAARWVMKSQSTTGLEYGEGTWIRKAQTTRNFNAEFFLFTDNSTAENSFYRGSSKSKLLHELVLRLRKLEMDFNL